MRPAGAPGPIRRAGIAAAVLATVLAPSAARSQATAIGDSTAAPIDTVTRRIDGSLTAGRVITRLVSRADTAQRYALYLPSAYARDRRWPVLFLLDPRGRALLPMRRFQPAAERHGYIVMSSYNTLSDGPLEPNYAAMNAMLEDVQRSLAVDSRRFYLVGFSGTARFAWQLSSELPGSVAGILGAGAAVPGGRSWIRLHIGSSAPVLFGAVGTLDPNYEELRAFDVELDSTRTPHHIERFDGPHEWPPLDVSARAVAWFELQAMRRGLTPRAQPWIDSLFSAWLDSAREREAAADLPGAARRYRLLRADFDGLADVAAVAAVAVRLRELEADPRVSRVRQAEDAAAERDRRAGEALVAFVEEIDRSPAPPALDQARRRVQLDVLQREAARGDDSVAAIAARRGLERVFTHMSFYVPRKQFAGRRFAHAALALQIARLIKPDDGGVCFDLSRALAQTGDANGALSALECAAASNRVGVATVEADALLEPLRASPRYQAVVRQLRERR